MQSIWLPTAMTLIKLRHLQLQCYVPGVVHAWRSVEFLDASLVSAAPYELVRINNTCKHVK